MTWQALADAAPELAAFGAERLPDQVAYLATVKADASPRLHPVRPVVTVGRLFMFVETTSPKVRDLQRGPRYALHATATSDTPWDLREFVVRGHCASRRLFRRSRDGQRRLGLPARRAIPAVRARRRRGHVDGLRV